MAHMATGNRRASLAVRGADFYPTPYPALAVLMHAEPLLPFNLWEPACGNGALVIPLRNRGYHVNATDLYNWGCPQSIWGVDFLQVPHRDAKCGIVTNPPFKIIKPFIERACALAPYVAILARLAFLESQGRFGWFERLGLRRVHVISDRLPMIHRHGWKGRKIGQMAMAFAWFVFREPVDSVESVELRWWLWRESVKLFPFQECDSPPGAVAGEVALFREGIDEPREHPGSHELGRRAGPSGVSPPPGHDLLPDS